MHQAERTPLSPRTAPADETIRGWMVRAAVWMLRAMWWTLRATWWTLRATWWTVIERRTPDIDAPLAAVHLAQHAGGASIVHRVEVDGEGVHGPIRQQRGIGAVVAVAVLLLDHEGRRRVSNSSLAMDQSDAGRAGIFSRRTNRVTWITKAAAAYT
eukprot:9473790-Pyramimonas_sp.AAC.2